MSQQRQLEVLQQRQRSGERPAVKIVDVEHEFGGVVWGGASPTVVLVDQDGVRTAKTAAAWTRQGAVFRARSRDLGKVARGGGAGGRGPGRSAAQLDREVKELVKLMGGS